MNANCEVSRLLRRLPDDNPLPTEGEPPITFGLNYTKDGNGEYYEEI